MKDIPINLEIWIELGNLSDTYILGIHNIPGNLTKYSEIMLIDNNNNSRTRN